MKQLNLSLSFLFFVIVSYSQNIGIGTTTPISKLSIGGSSQFQVDSVGNIKKINNVFYSFPPTQGSTGQVLTNNGSGNLTWSSSGGGSGWGLSGNSGTNASANFIGTSDSVALVIKVNNYRSGLIDPGNFSTFYGMRAGKAITTGEFNTAIGSYAFASNTTGHWNTAIGESALLFNVEGHGNTACGVRALRANTTGNWNTATGKEALYANTTGNYNTANGSRALFGNYSGSYNCALGYDALYINTTGTQNVGLGYLALCLNTTGNGNTGVGTRSLYQSTIANGNTAIGSGAGDGAVTNGNFNTFLGNNTYATAAGFTHSTVIGSTTTISASYQVRVGSSSVTSIGGPVGWTNLSDARVKTNIQNNVPGLDFILKLNPVTYTIDVTKLDKWLHPRGFKIEPTQEELDAKVAKSKIVYTGFIAQDVEAVANTMGYNFSGVDAPKNDKDLYGLRYAEFVVPIVKAMQEQQKMIDDLQKQVLSLQQTVLQLQK